jgi:hypothetical protein
MRFRYPRDLCRVGSDHPVQAIERRIAARYLRLVYEIAGGDKSRARGRS